MSFTNEALKALKAKLEALNAHLGKTSLALLNAGDAPKNLEALKEQVEDKDLGGITLSGDEWGYLDVQAPANNDDVAQAQATEMVTEALTAAIAKINTCIDLTDDKLAIIGKDLTDFFDKPQDDLTTYAKAAGKMDIDNLGKVGFEKIAASANLKPTKLASIFNNVAAGQDDVNAKTAFIDALKNDNGLGHILSAEAKATETNPLKQNKFQKDFDNAAGELFDSCARFAKKTQEDKFEKDSFSLDSSSFENFKAFVGALVKFALVIPAVLEFLGIGKDFLQSDRAKRTETFGKFEKLLKDNKSLDNNLSILL